MARAIAKASAPTPGRGPGVAGRARIRAAGEADAPALAALSREAFPMSLRWLSRTAGEAWWRGALRSDRAVVWMAEDEAGITGFVLVHDGTGWEAEEPGERVGRWRRVGETLTARAALRLPAIALRRMARRVRYRGAAGAAPAPGPAAWLESIGVARRARGQGVGRALLERVGESARRLGLGMVRLRVDIDNAPARRMYERAGWTLLRTVGDSCHYERGLERKPEREASRPSRTTPS